MFTARAVTRAPIASDTEDGTSVVSLAHLDGGMTSAGPNAVVCLGGAPLTRQLWNYSRNSGRGSLQAAAPKGACELGR
jgi:hypothetical protein